MYEYTDVCERVYVCVCAKSACTPSRTVTGRLSWLLRKQTKERNEGTSALGGLAPLFMGHCICWPRITLCERASERARPVWSHLTSDFTFDSLLANGSRISIRCPPPVFLIRYAATNEICCAIFRRRPTKVPRPAGLARQIARSPRDRDRNQDRNRGRTAADPSRSRTFDEFWSDKTSVRPIAGELFHMKIRVRTISKHLISDTDF